MQQRHVNRKQEAEPYQYVLGIMPFAIIIVGQWYPLVGLIMLGCMAAGIAISFFRGRLWCGKACPRGALYDIYAGRFSRNADVPSWFTHWGYRILWLAVLMGMLGFRMIQSGGSPELLGAGLVQMIIMTTGIGIILALVYTPRAWCLFCPLGTITSWTGKGKAPILIDEKRCINCGKCYQVCPMGIRASDYQSNGAVNNGDCIKCRKCVSACPKDALT